jgi:hypothetical protein
VLPHAHVHCRRDKDWAAERDHRLREDVVCEAVCELRERVRRKRRDHEQIGVHEVRIEVARRLAPREGLEGVRRDEALRVGREEGRDLVTRLHEQPDELARLVGRDAACDADQNASHEAP